MIIGHYCYDNDKGKYCGIAIVVSRNLKEINLFKRYSITDDLETIELLLNKENFVLLSPISYVGSSKNN